MTYTPQPGDIPPSEAVQRIVEETRDARLDARLAKAQEVNRWAQRAFRGTTEEKMRLGGDINKAAAFLRNTIAQSPGFGSEFTVVSIDTEPQDLDMLWLRLSNGKTIVLTIEVTE